MSEDAAADDLLSARPTRRRIVSLLTMGVVLAWFVIHVAGDGWPEGAALAAAAVVADLGGSVAEDNAVSAGISLLVVALLLSIAVPAIDAPLAVFVGAAGLLGPILFAAGYVVSSRGA